MDSSSKKTKQKKVRERILLIFTSKDSKFMGNSFAIHSLISSIWKIFSGNNLAFDPDPLIKRRIYFNKPLNRNNIMIMKRIPFLLSIFLLVGLFFSISSPFSCCDAFLLCSFDFHLRPGYIFNSSIISSQMLLYL